MENVSLIRQYPAKYGVVKVIEYSHPRYNTEYQVTYKDPYMHHHLWTNDKADAIKFAQFLSSKY